MTYSSWRTPFVILSCGTLILLVSFGARQVSGLFIAPVSADLGWSRDIFSTAIAAQALVWGLCTPFSGAFADRFGAGRVVAVGGALYALGLFLLSQVETPLGAVFSLGILTGIGMSTAGFSVILAVIGRVVPNEKRSLYLGIASAGGSSGQFIMIPATQHLMDGYGWSATLVLLALLVGLIVPLAATLAGDKPATAAAGGRGQSFRQAIAEAGKHRGYLLLMGGYFVCGFQVSFISAHLPGYITDSGMAASVAAWALSLVGLFNIIGCFFWGRLGDLYSKKYLLSFIYMARAGVMAVFLIAPLSEMGTLVFGAAIGLLWLATVPLVTGMIAQIFGVQYLATLTGLVFMGHQAGSAAGVWLGGRLQAATGNYDAIWWIAIGLGVAAAVIHWPIDERPLIRAAPGEA